MKKKINLWVALCGSFLLGAICCVLVLTVYPRLSKDNFENDMKIPNPNPLNNQGADIWDRVGDHTNSPYFYNLDFYNMKSSASRFILPRFKTLQQRAWWS